MPVGKRETSVNYYAREMPAGWKESPGRRKGAHCRAKGGSGYLPHARPRRRLHSELPHFHVGAERVGGGTGWHFEGCDVQLRNDAHARGAAILDRDRHLGACCDRLRGAIQNALDERRNGGSGIGDGVAQFFDGRRVVADIHRGDILAGELDIASGEQQERFRIARPESLRIFVPGDAMLVCGADIAYQNIHGFPFPSVLDTAVSGTTSAGGAFACLSSSASTGATSTHRSGVFASTVKMYSNIGRGRFKRMLSFMAKSVAFTGHSQ